MYILDTSYPMRFDIIPYDLAQRSSMQINETIYFSSNTIFMAMKSGRSTRAMRKPLLPEPLA